MTCLFAKVYVFLCFFYISRCCSHYIHYISNWITIVILFCRWPINCHKGMGGLTVSHQCQDQLAKNQPGWTFMNFSVRLVVRRVGENGNANSIQNWNFFWRNLNRSVSSESPCPTKACIFRFQVRFFGEYIYIYICGTYIPCAWTRECEDYLQWSLMHPFFDMLERGSENNLERPARNLPELDT